MYFKGGGQEKEYINPLIEILPLPISKIITVNWSAVRALDSIDKSLMTCDDVALLYILRKNVMFLRVAYLLIILLCYIKAESEEAVWTFFGTRNICSCFMAHYYVI